MRGEDTLARRRGGSIFLEDVRHSSVLYVCKYFVELMNQMQRKQENQGLTETELCKILMRVKNCIVLQVNDAAVRIRQVIFGSKVQLFSTQITEQTGG